MAKRRALDAHPAVLRQVERMAAELERWRRGYTAHVVAAAKAAVAAKDEEIERARWLNWQLQEQARAAHAEAQAWHNSAVRAEAAAAALRAALDRELRAEAAATAAGADDDAGSCCYGDNGGAGGEDDTERRGVGTTCSGCGERAAAVVLLPCRHLSACAPCAAAARACPACGRHKVGSVAVNPVV